MITYIVLKCRSPDTDVMRDQGLKALRAELTFEPDFSVVHTDPKRGTICIVIGRQDPLVRPRFLYDDDGFLVLNGPAVGFDYSPSSAPLLQTVRDALRNKGWDATYDTLKGTYNLAGSIGDEVFAFSDFSGLYPVYQVAGPRLHAFSNRATALSRLRHGRTRQDAGVSLCASWWSDALPPRLTLHSLASSLASP